MTERGTHNDQADPSLRPLHPVDFRDRRARENLGELGTIARNEPLQPTIRYARYILITLATIAFGMGVN
jgi:hypothetical protein